MGMGVELTGKISTENFFIVCVKHEINLPNVDFSLKVVRIDVIIFILFKVIGTISSWKGELWFKNGDEFQVGGNG